MKTLRFAAYIFLFLSQQSFAGGNVVGNGGDAVVCTRDNGAQYAQVLDYVEAKNQQAGFEIDMGAPTLEPIAKVRLVLSRLARRAPQRAAAYLTAIENMLNSDPFVEQSLEDVQDSDHLGVLIPSGCHVEQAAIQFKQVLTAQDKKYLINRRLYSLMNNDQRAGLLLHEVIYTEALKYGNVTSVQTRQLNSHLVSKSYGQLTDREFFDMFLRAGFSFIEVGGVQVAAGTDVSVEPYYPLFFPNGNVREVYAERNSIIYVQNQPVRVRGYLEFFDSGEIFKFYTNESATLKNVQGNMVFINSLTQVTLSKSGLVQKIN